MPFECHRNWPVNIQESDKIIFEKDVNKVFPDIKIHRLENTNLTPEGIVFKNLSVNKHFLIWPSHSSIYNKIYLSSTLVKRKKIKLNTNQKYIACFDYWSNGYYHWMCDFLPRLWYIREYLPDNILLLPENYRNSFIEETLKAFSVKNAYYIPLNSYVQCRHLIIPDRITESGDNDPEIMNEVKKQIVNYFNLNTPANPSEKIYSSRALAKYRHIVNEKEVIDLVQKYNFKSTCFEKMLFKEQIQTMLSAKYFIGLHGANLTNLLFMKPGASILELRKPDKQHSNCYFSLSDSMKHKYYYLHCNSVPSNKKGDHYGDILADITELKESIHLMLH